MADAIALLPSAVLAAGPAPDDPAGQDAWLKRVTSLAGALSQQLPVIEALLGRLAEVVPISGTITSVEEVSGRGVIHLHPSVGKDANDPGADEVFRTTFLTDSDGAAMFAQAQSLVGKPVFIGKYLEKKSDGSGQSVRIAMWLRLDPRGQSHSGSGHTAAPVARPAPAHHVTRENRRIPPRIPASSQELITRAMQDLGLDAEDVRREATRLLGPLEPGLARTTLELGRLWEHLCGLVGTQ